MMTRREDDDGPCGARAAVRRGSHGGRRGAIEAASQVCEEGKVFGVVVAVVAVAMFGVVVAFFVAQQQLRRSGVRAPLAFRVRAPGIRYSSQCRSN